MLKNYFISAYRNVLKHKTSFFINLISLGIAASCTLLILLYTYREFTFERNHHNRDRIYRLAISVQMDEQTSTYAANVPSLAPTIDEVIPEIENYVRLRNDLGGVWIHYNGHDFETENMLVADSSFFNVFTYDFIEGDKTALREPQLVITEQLAKILFGDSSALGKTVFLNKTYPLTIGAVIRAHDNSHLKFGGLLPWHVLPKDEGWDDAHAYTYVLLNKEHSLEAFSQKIENFIATNENVKEVAEKLGAKIQVITQPLNSIHLYSHLQSEISQNGNILLLYVFISVAAFFLINACINHININLASSLTRAKEVALRKVAGASLNQLKWQYLSEAFILIVIAFTIGLGITILTLPYFSRLINIRLDLHLLIQPTFITVVLIVIFTLTFLSGLYPAFYAASFKPAMILHSSTTPTGLFSLRKILLIAQLTISTLIVSATFIVISQIDLITKNEIGFSKENIMIVNIPLGDKTIAFKEALKKNTAIHSIASCNYTPGHLSQDEFIIENAKGEMKPVTAKRVFFDENYVDVLSLKITRGRNFSDNFESDYQHAFLVNESAVAAYGWQEPIGKKIKAINYGREGVIVGVVKDASLFSLHKKAEPIIMNLSAKNYDWGEVAHIKFTPESDIQTSILLVQRTFKEIFGDHIFRYSFLDKSYDAMFKSEKQLARILTIGSIVLLVIACLGLFGISNFAAAQRNKEMGIRKSLGASVMQIAMLHLKYFTLLALLASIIAWPLSYYTMSLWLDNFTMRISVNFFIFFFSSAITIIAVLITAGIHALKLSKINPVTVLRL